VGLEPVEVINYAYSKYRDTGLFPKDHSKRGQIKSFEKSPTLLRESAQAHNFTTMDNLTRPALKLRYEDKAANAFEAKKFQPQSELMGQTFSSFDTFKQNLPDDRRTSVTKIDYEGFKKDLVTGKRMHDSNLTNVIETGRKFLAAKNREQSLRAMAMAHNP